MQKYTVVGRDRNQLTIPRQISNNLSWLGKDKPIDIIVLDAESVVLKPATQGVKPDSNKIWQKIRLARSFYGEGHVMSSSEFIAWDRQHGHRF